MYIIVSDIFHVVYSISNAPWMIAIPVTLLKTPDLCAYMNSYSPLKILEHDFSLFTTSNMFGGVRVLHVLKWNEPLEGVVSLFLLQCVWICLTK